MAGGEAESGGSGLDGMSQQEFDFEAKTEPPKSEATKAIIDRIKKLLRLGADKRGNAHEAERALQLAYELAEKYRVDMAGLNLDEATEAVMHEAWDMGMRFDRLRRGIVQILMRFFHVNVVLAQPKINVIGKPTDVLIAHYVHDFLLRTGRNCLKAYELEEKRQRRRVSTTKRANYLEGFIYGQWHRLDGCRERMPLTDSHAALVVTEEADREQYVEKNWTLRGNVKSLPDIRKNESAALKGFRDGKNTAINQPLEGSGRGSTLLLE